MEQKTQHNRWKEFEGKNIFVQLKSGRKYSGRDTEVDLSSPPVIFISFKDKFDRTIAVVASEISVIQEEPLQ